MKKVSILNKSTLSRHFNRDPENSQFASNNYDEPLTSIKDTTASQSFPQSESSSIAASTFTAATTFNPHLLSRSSTTKVAQPTRLGVVPNSFSSPRRHMYSKAADRSVAINERIERMARKWTSLESSPCTFDELSHPTRASQESIVTVGRIVCDSDAKLNENSVLLESSRSIGSGVRVPLNLSSVPNYSLFPGQIVMLEGVNPDGKCLHVKQFLQPQNTLMKIPKLPEVYGHYEQFADGVLSVMIAAGPFTLDVNSKSNELDYSPLDSLLSSVVMKRPEVLILCGPFIDSENSAARLGSLQYLPDQIFHLEITLRLNELKEKCPEIRILLVPSLKDLHSSTDNIFPQPPLLNLKFDNVLISCLSNPSIFFINEICFSISNNEILLPLAQQSIARTSTDRMTRISNHLLEQMSLYPLMPAATGANLDYSILEDIELPFTPDILISPSSLGAFARTIDNDSVCLNPGLFCRKASLGTAAILSFNRPMHTNEDSIAKRNISSRQLQISIYNKLFLVAFSLDSLQMNLKTCLQFDETDSSETEAFNHLEFCLNLADSDTLIYADGNFLSSSCEEDFPIFEFASGVTLIKEVVFKNEKFFFVVLEDSNIIIIDLKTKKLLKQFYNVLPSKIIQIRQQPSPSPLISSSVYLLTESSSIFQIENFILFTRLTQDSLNELYEAGQILKEFNLESKVNDFYLLSDDGNLKFLTVGSDQMVSWWRVPPFNDPNSTKTSIINFLSSAFVKPPKEEAKKPPKFPLKQVKFLHEPDRVINKILLVQGNLALLEDSLHGRLIVLDTELAVILRIFKGYRNCSAKLSKDHKLVIWAGNRFALETWENFPFCEESKPKIQEFPHCRGKIEENDNFYLYNPENHQLNHYLLNE